METLESILRDHRVALAPAGHHHSRPGWLQFDCPFCTPGTHRYRMGHNLAVGSCNCYYCGRHGLAEVIAAVTGCTMRQAIAQRRQLEFKPPQYRYTRPTRPCKLPSGISALLPAHTHYLATRGRQAGYTADDIVRLYEVQGLGPLAALRWRLFIPITLNGQVVSWTTRAINDKGRRYHSAKDEEEAIPHKHLLYGSALCRDTVVVVEGPTDVWAIGPGAVGTFGTAYTQPQVAALTNYRHRVICSDKKAQVHARRLRDSLAGYSGTTDIVQLEADDPGSATAAELHELRAYYGLPGYS